MTKKLTKEQLAKKLDGLEYRENVPKELLELAKENNLLIVSGASDDIVSFSGAFDDETYAIDGGEVLLSRKGIPLNRCDDEDCPYFAENLHEAIKYGIVQKLKVYWCGQCKSETLLQVEYEALGEPTWHYTTKMPHASFDIFDHSNGDEREYYCRAIVIDLDEAFNQVNYVHQS